MPDTTISEKPASATPSALFAEALKNPLVLATRRAELVQLATESATKLAADARTRVEVARSGAAARVQSLRKAGGAMITSAIERSRACRAAAPAQLRRAAHGQVLRAALALQALAKRLEPVAAPAAPAPAEMPTPTANA